MSYSDTADITGTMEEGDKDSQKRHRKHTEKGLAYNMDLKGKHREQVFKQLERKSEHIKSAMIEDITVSEMNTMHAHWMTIYENFMYCCDEYSSLLDDDIVKEQDNTDWVAPRTAYIKSFKTMLEKWFQSESHMNTVKPIVKTKTDDSVSQVSTKSRHSSMASSVSSARLKEEQRRAELEVKASRLQQKREIEQAKLQLQQQQEQLQIEEEMAMSSARAKVLDTFEGRYSHEPVIVHVSDDQLIHRDRIRQQNAVHLNPVAQVFSPTYSHTIPSVHQPPLRPPETDISSVVRHLRKPAAEIKKFSGNPLEYKRFMRQFKTKIVCNSEDDDERLNYLEQYTVGEANAIVTGLSYLDGTVAYEAAIRELEERYGDPDIIVNAFIKRALSWPFIKATNPKGLDEFAIFLVECLNAAQTMEAMKVLEYSENMRQLVCKLPYHFHDKWRNLVCLTRERGETVMFKQLVDFVKREAKKANDPTYGKEAMGTEQRDLERKGVKLSRRTRGTFATNTTEYKPQEKSSETKSKNDDSETKSKNDNSETKSQSHRHTYVQPASKQPCIYCEDPHHSLDACDNLFKLTFSDRIEVLKKRGLCYGCLKSGGHIRKDCKYKATCQHCNGRHPTILHYGSTMQNKATSRFTEKSSASVNVVENIQVPGSNLSSHMGAGEGHVDCTMAIIPVKVRMQNGLKEINTYAFMDPGSNVSFCSKKLMEQLRGVSNVGKSVRITMDTMGIKHTMNTYLVKGLEVCDLQSENVIILPDVYTKDRIPVSKHHIPTDHDLEQWPHLSGITLPQIDAEVGLLIGNNVPDAYTPIELRTGPRGSPHASRTLLGWIAWNVCRSTEVCNFNVNRADVIAIEEVEELKKLNQLYEKSVNLDFPERTIDDHKEHSQEDRKFIEKVFSSKELIDGHYQFCLPFRNDLVKLPNNREQAVQRLKYLKKKMYKDPKFHEDYKEFMRSIIDKGYAEVVPEQELTRADGKVWYVPHHGVYHPQKPSKIRVVFDCAARYEGVSLNSVLLQGPDLTSNLLGVLLRFRQDENAIMGDIESMYYQVRVPREDRDCLRFLWWPKGVLNSLPVVYRMAVHLFGAVSSPSCSNLALRQTAEDNSKQFDPVVKEALERNFYVDDFLKSVSTEHEAIALVSDVTCMCQLGGFHLTKWVSNNRAVLDTIPIEERAKELRQLDLDCDDLPQERALGVSWSVESDVMGFKIMIRNPLPTRRNVLSIVSSVYDPLGLAAPFVLPAKLLLQDLCRRHVDWDIELSGSDLQRWQHWLHDLPRLEQLQMMRCYKPAGFGIVTSFQIHNFCDASEQGYGMVSYIRQTNEEGFIHCSLLIGKSRVAPLKKNTIPRMELTAATVAVRMYKKIQHELDIRIDEVYFWTDSMTVIRYIMNETTRFQTFVANRINVIREGTDVNQWKYVGSQVNPADDASRGLALDNVSQIKRWMNGPKFLWGPESGWPQTPNDCNILPEDDPEIRKVTNATFVQKDTDVMDRLLSQFSDWMKLKKITAWIIVFIENTRSLCLKRKQIRDQMLVRETDPDVREQMVDAEMRKITASAMHESPDKLKTLVLSNATLQDAEMALHRYEQNQHFPDEMKILMNVKNGQDGKLKKCSPLYKLDPQLVDGVLRLGGRLEHADMQYDAKHPIILAKTSPMSILILEDMHKAVGHLGRNTVLAKLRQRYWIIGANQIIRKLLSRCVICRKYQGHCSGQKMADLPHDRINPDEPPFTHVGMDYFGPIEVKRGRTTVKRYGVIFTCMAVRAVHLEVAYSLDTDSCINAIRRFIARRGTVKSIRSDNGTNLVGAEREMREEIGRWNEAHFQESLRQPAVTWKFNPPGGSHFGGVWERLIRSVRKILYSLLHEQMAWRLDDELLQTLFCEIESIMNSRPITTVSGDMNDLDVLTPNHLLLLRPGSSLPCGLFDENDNYARRRWRQIQYLSDIFWKRWIKEYLPTLQIRQKWNQPQRNVCEGDLVLLVDNVPRSSWTLGRVLSVMKDKKGHVRIVQVKTKSNVLQRPVDKLCVILEGDSSVGNNTDYNSD